MSGAVLLLMVDASERPPPAARTGSRKDWIQLEAPWVRSLSSTAVSLVIELSEGLRSAGRTVSQSVPAHEQQFGHFQV